MSEGSASAWKVAGAVIATVLSLAAGGLRVYLAVRPEPKPDPVYVCAGTTVPQIGLPPTGPPGGVGTPAIPPAPRVSDEPCD